MLDKSATLKEVQKYLAKGAIDKAISELEQLVHESPEGNVFNMIGDLYLKKGVQKSGIDYYLKAANYFRQEGFSQKAQALYRKIYHAIQRGLIRSCHDCSDGGLGVALAETAFAGGLGMDIDLGKVPRIGLDRSDFLLFSESQSRLVVTIDPAKKTDFESSLTDSVWGEIGVVSGKQIFRITGLKGKIVIQSTLAELKESWQKTLRF